MPLETIQQVAKALQTKKHILITTRANPSGDCLASALAFYALARKLKKKAAIAIDTSRFGLPERFSFLPEYANIRTELSRESDIVLEFDLNQDSLRGLTYDVRNHTLTVRVFPKEPGLTLGPVRQKNMAYPYDAIVVVDACDLESLGSVYDEHTEFFYHTDIINIDHSSENEHFGQINLVEMSAVATAEILFTVAEHLGPELIDPNLATCLLAGIVHESRSFQTNNITPKTLAIASELVSLGANRAEVMKQLYYNKPVSSLRLWGKMLSNIQVDEAAQLAWVAVTKEDFESAHAGEKDLLDVLDDLLQHAPESRAICIAYPGDEGFHAVVHTHDPSLDLRRALGRLGAFGSRNLVSCSISARNGDEAIFAIKSLLTH
ncbi:MAG: DHH family phosphoesterase [bacterium]|nr:DHH family phosphoesterase [bacterium]